MPARGRYKKQRPRSTYSGARKKKIFQLIVNTAAGNDDKEARRLAERFKRRAMKRGQDCYISQSTEWSQLCQMTTQAAQRRPYAVVVFGGDGTVRMAAERVVKSRGLLGIIPCGRHNNIFTSLYGQLEAEEALDILHSQYQTRIDVALANDQVFVGYLACGLVPAMIERLGDKHLPKMAMGWSKLAGHAAAETVTRVTSLKVDSYQFDAEPIILNIHLLPRLLTLPFAPAAIPDDGRMILIYDNGNKSDVLAHYVRDLKKDKYQYHDSIQLVRGRRISIRPALGRKWIIDGDPVEFERDELSIEVLHQALRIFTYAPDDQ